MKVTDVLPNFTSSIQPSAGVFAAVNMFDSLSMIWSMLKQGSDFEASTCFGLFGSVLANIKTKKI